MTDVSTRLAAAMADGCRLERELHSHILPCFDSGTADGFLFYLMPFIDGETLPAKLDRGTQLGTDEAVRIITEWCPPSPMTDGISQPLC